MKDDLNILLEWFYANGIEEFFNNSPNIANIKNEEFEGIINLNANKNIDVVIEHLAKKQSSQSKLLPFEMINKIKEIADNCNSIEEIKKIVDELEAYEGYRGLANSTLFYSKKSADILIINDLPSEEDDKNSSFFSGEVGDLFGKILKSVAINLEDCCCLNTFFWRLSGSRSPMEKELNLCKPFVERFISLLKPKLIIFTGNYSINILTNLEGGILKNRGKEFKYTNEYLLESIQSFSLYSPYFILDDYEKRRKIVWEDLKILKNILLTS